MKKNSLSLQYKQRKMADITKCFNEKCPLKESCYRFTAPNSHHQSFSDFQFEEDGGEVSCKYFWSNEDRKYNYISKETDKKD